MAAAKTNIIRGTVLTRQNKRAIIMLPNIGKEDTMQTQESQEEVLDRVFTKLSKMSDEQIAKLVRIATAEGIDLTEKEPRE